MIFALAEMILLLPIVIFAAPNTDIRAANADLGEVNLTDGFAIQAQLQTLTEKVDRK